MSDEILFDNGKAGDSVFQVGRASDGRLWVTTNANTRHVFTPRDYNAWSGADIEEMREDLVAMGVSEELAEEYVRQATIWP